MKPANFPARVARRQLRAQMPKNGKTEPELDSVTRNFRTKVRRQAKSK